ncbi:hypothetical protein D3C86_1499940 [compost metagenome]
MRKQQRNIRLAFAQRRYRQRHHIQPVIEVLAKRATFGRIAKIDLGRRHHANIDRPLLVRPEWRDLAHFQHTQHLHLHRKRHAFDLIQKQGAAARMFDAADAFFLCAGKSSRLMAEKLAFNHRFRQRPAIERHEITFRAFLAPAVKGRCHHFLAAAGLASHQHIHVGIGNVPKRGAQALHGRRLADQRQIILCLPRRPAKGAVFQHQPALFQRPAGTFHHALGRKWLGDKIISAVVKRIDGHRHIAMPCDEDDRQIGIDLADMVEKL